MKLSTKDFQTPSVEYRPWTRWWWPGGAVEREELLREVRLFADNFFGGAEIQPFVAGIKRETYLDATSAVASYGSPDYYQKIAAVLEEAQKSGIQIDLTLNSGWPAGGEFVPLEDNPDTLLYGEATITQAVKMPVPPPIMPFAYSIFTPDSILPLLRGREWTQTLTYHPEKAELVAVVAAKITDNQRSPDPSVLTDTLALDVTTALDISDSVRDGYLDWQPPSSGEWQIVSIYTMPSGSRTLLSAETGETYTLDPFDSPAIQRYYDNWLGAHPEILHFAGTTLRALFSDSYEFFAQRHFSQDLLKMFEDKRGYDVTHLLPAVFQPAQDQWFFFFTGLRTAPDFTFGEVSQRIIYDYNLTISDLFFEHWYSESCNWAEKNNLLFRQQGYNPPLDVIKAAGAAHIPETEGGNELLLKRVASGGHLYGKEIISAESFVFFPKGGYALTPQDYKQGIDVLMTAGVNHIIYHGTPYRWDEAGYGETGWSPFISPYGSNISANISEADSFWKFQQDINQYAARLQYLLRQGKPDADVAVYLPLFQKPDDSRFAPTVDTINASGYAWEWVNDELITQASWTDDGIEIGAMIFQAIVLPNVEAIPLATAKSVMKLAEQGAPIIIFGEHPTQQPSYFNYEVQDAQIASLMSTIANLSTSIQTTASNVLLDFIQQLQSDAIHYETNTALRFIRRKLDDGQYVVFIRNTSDTPTDFTLTLTESCKFGYWFDAMTGDVNAARVSDGKAYGTLTRHGSIVLLCSPTQLFADEIFPPSDSSVVDPQITQSIPLADWTLQVTGDDVAGGKITITTDALGDWATRDDLKYVSSIGIYRTTLNLSEFDANKKHVLNLGVVHSAAEVTVNGQSAGHAIFAPYQLDITDYLKHGENSIRVEVTPVLKNRSLGKALSGHPEYVQYINGFMVNKNPVPSGLVGPVSIDVVSTFIMFFR